MLNRSASLVMSTSVLKALPGKLDIKIHSPSILYILYGPPDISMHRSRGGGLEKHKSLQVSIEVSKGAKIRNRYNQAPHLTQDTNGKVTNSQLYTTDEGQEVSPFPASDHKAQINRCAQRHCKHKTGLHRNFVCHRVPWLYQYWQGGFMLFVVLCRGTLKAQPAVVLVLKRLRRQGNGLRSHPTDWEKPGIEPATPGLQDIGLSPTPCRLSPYSLIELRL